jgi:hypothetical protein
MDTDAPGKCSPHTKQIYVYKTIAKAVEKYETLLKATSQ